MEKNSLEAMRQILNVSSLAQMLFDGETMVAASPEAVRLIPVAREGCSAEKIFGATTETYRQYSGSGSMFFTAELAGVLCDVTVTALDGYRLVTMTASVQIQHTATMLAIAERVRQPMAAIMAVTPKLLPLLEETSDRHALERAAELNQGLYSILRVTSNLELYAEHPLAVHCVPVDLGAWLQNLADQMLPMFQTMDRRLEFLRSPGSHLCYLDERQMEVAILNLISNAIKFSGPGDEVTLSFQRRGSHIRITVRDRGTGIPADQMGNVFHRSEHRGLIPNPQWGAGLGLPVARKIVEAHGGRLMLESQEHVGTAVHISLETRVNPDGCVLRSPVRLPDYSGGIDPMLVALADVLPASVFDTRKVDL